MEWNVEASLELIERYRSQPVLWNTRHSYYYTKTMKKKAWKAIANNMGLDVKEVRQKMNSLMGSFRRERSKMRRGEGRYALGNFPPRWFAFDKMTFLLNRNEELSDHKVYLEELQKMPEEAEEAEEAEEDLALDSDSNQLLEEELNDLSEETLTADKGLDGDIQAPPAKKVKTEHYSSGPTNQDSTTCSDQDECLMYGQYLAKKLMRMSCKTRALVKHSINNIVFEADLGKYNNVQQTQMFDNFILEESPSTSKDLESVGS